MRDSQVRLDGHSLGRHVTQELLQVRGRVFDDLYENLLVTALVELTFLQRERQPKLRVHDA